MSSSTKVHTYEDVVRNKNRENCWLLISEKVYDVTPFLDDHPGGDEVIMAAAGKDATDDFEDVGHSDDARDLMNKYYIGEIDSATVPVKAHKPPPSASSSSSAGNETSGSLIKILQFLIPLLILGLAYAIREYNKKEE